MSLTLKSASIFHLLLMKLNVHCNKWYWVAYYFNNNDDEVAIKSIKMQMVIILEHLETDEFMRLSHTQHGQSFRLPP